MEKEQKQVNDSHAAPENTSGAEVFVCRFPGVVSGAGKSIRQLKQAFYDLLEEHEAVLAVRVDEAAGTALITAFPEGEYDPAACVFLIRPSRVRNGNVFILAGGKEDLPAALEARYALAACGAESTMVITRGAAEPGSLAELQGRLSCAAACIAVAGKDNTLPGIAAALTQSPVIALPVTVCGASPLESVMSLAGILARKGTGLTVVSTDDGLGAGFAAARIINSSVK